MPTVDGKTTQHHCPLKGGNKGNCRNDKKMGGCKSHQIKCRDHDMVHVKTEGCKMCEDGMPPKKKKMKKKKD